MFSADKIIETSCIVDDFCIEFDKVKDGHVLDKDNNKKRRNRSFKLSDSEVIMILFHTDQFLNIKHFYINYVMTHLHKEFPQTVSYIPFVELQQKTVMLLVICLNTFCMGACTGVSCIDSTPEKVCHIRREHSNKVFKGMATKGQCSIGWFFGFKLHLIINDKGEILNFMIIQKNINDREPLKQKSFYERIFGKLIGDKGYISQTLFEQLFIDGIHLITKIRKNMKNCLMHIHDKILLKKKALIETINDELKNICQIERECKFDLIRI